MNETDFSIKSQIYTDGEQTDLPDSLTLTRGNLFIRNSVEGGQRQMRFYILIQYNEYLN